MKGNTATVVEMGMVLKNMIESINALHTVIYAPIVTFCTTLRMSAENQNRKCKATLMQQPCLKHCVQSNILTITFCNSVRESWEKRPSVPQLTVQTEIQALPSDANDLGIDSTLRSQTSTAKT
ncbi:hypothetical protein RRG08_031723 [Elysia crispata]|uniref:Uncharacterized protein n=1 Tax=Elysia crispata TaxID=231223 RepID=A0AAE0ZF62_9GAST|nr:hypothetical protein RRG08_031723 [Elysia crispata]